MERKVEPVRTVYSRAIRALAALLLFAALLLAFPGHAEEDGLSYAMDVTLDAQSASLTVEARVAVVNDSPDAWEELCFRDFMASVIAEARTRTDEELSLQSGILSASCGGEMLEVRVDAADASIVYVALKTPLASGDRCEIALSYAADIPEGGLRCGYFPLHTESEAGRTFELAQFYPMLAVYEDGGWVVEPYFVDGECFYTRCADYDIRLHVPEGYTVVASGDETEEAPSLWRIHADRMRDVTLIASDELDVACGEAEGVMVNCYYARGEESHRRQNELSMQAALDAIRAFTDAYGQYPYAELDVVESNYEFGGMEAPGLVRVSQMYSWFFGSDTDAAERAEYEGKLAATVAHETAHQWFYAVVGNDQYREAWLDESFAAYSEQVYWRFVGKSEDDIAAQMDVFANAVNEAEDVSNLCIDRPYDELGGDYTPAVYERGAAFLYRLEQALGRETFSAAMREYYAAFAFKEAATQDFLAVFRPYAEGNEDAQALFATYLRAAR